MPELAEPRLVKYHELQIKTYTCYVLLLLLLVLLLLLLLLLV